MTLGSRAADEPSAGATDAGAGIDPSVGRAVLDVAVDAIAHALRTGRRRVPEPASLPGPLAAPGASFVTLEHRRQLVGCIGTIEARRPLGVDVAENALGAAFRDPRFPPLTIDLFVATHVKVSVLTPPVRRDDVDDLPSLRRALRAGVDGVLIDAPRHRATFLPAVWEKLPDPDDFLAHLWRKAGLRPSTWPEGLVVSTYRSIEVVDTGPRPEVGVGAAHLPPQGTHREHEAAPPRRSPVRTTGGDRPTGTTPEATT